MDAVPGSSVARLLVVESDPQTADYVVAVLRSGGYLVQSATHVGEALTIDHSRFKLAVVNGALHDAQGVSIRQRIALNPSFVKLPVLYISLERLPIDDRGLLDRVRVMLERGTKGDTKPENWEEPILAEAKGPQKSAETNQARQRVFTEDDIPTEPRRLNFDLHLKQQLAELKILANLGRSISSVLELNEVLNQIVAAATTLTGAEECMLLLPDVQRKALFLRAMKGVDDRSAKDFRVRVEDPLVGKVFTTGEAILLSDKGSQRVKTEYFVKSLLYVPLTYRNQIIGVLGVQNRSANHAFTYHDQELLVDLAAQAAIAIENARHFEERLIQNRQLTMLLDAGKAVNSTLALGDVLTILCQQMLQVLEVNACVISQQESSSGDLYPLAEVRRIMWGVEYGPKTRLQDRPILTKALAKNAFYALQRDRPGADWKPEVALLTQYNAQEMWVLPIRPANQPAIGIIELYYADAAPAVTDDFRARIRDAAIEIFGLLSTTSAVVPTRTIFANIENILNNTHAAWVTLSLLQNQTTLIKMIDYGSAVFVNKPLPQPTTLPHNVNEFVGESLLNYNARDSALAEEIRAAMTATGAEALLSMPLTIKGTPFGAVTLYNTLGTRRFRSEEISLALTLVTQAATAIENARLFSDLERSLADLQQAQVSLVQAARLSTMGELSAVVAHQINNPLTTIMVDSEMILQDLAPADPLRDGVTAIHRAGLRAHTVVKRLLSTARRDKSQESLVPIDLHETIRNTLDLITTHIERSKIKFEIALEDAAPIYVQAAPGHLEDLWLNLLLNAHDALLDVPGATITLRSRLFANGVEVSVCDNGNGIPPEIVPHIFEPFFTTKPAGEGTGLGLYICKQITDRCGGTIHAESVLNEGTCFQIMLPTEEPKPD